MARTTISHLPQELLLQILQELVSTEGDAYALFKVATSSRSLYIAFLSNKTALLKASAKATFGPNYVLAVYLAQKEATRNDIEKKLLSHEEILAEFNEKRDQILECPCLLDKGEETLESVIIAGRTNPVVTMDLLTRALQTHLLVSKFALYLMEEIDRERYMWNLETRPEVGSPRWHERRLIWEQCVYRFASWGMYQQAVFRERSLYQLSRQHPCIPIPWYEFEQLHYFLKAAVARFKTIHLDCFRDTELCSDHGGFWDTLKHTMEDNEYEPLRYVQFLNWRVAWTFLFEEGREIDWEAREKEAIENWYPGGEEEDERKGARGCGSEECEKVKFVRDWEKEKNRVFMMLMRQLR